MKLLMPPELGQQSQPSLASGLGLASEPPGPLGNAHAFFRPRALACASAAMLRAAPVQPLLKATGRPALPLLLA